MEFNGNMKLNITSEMVGICSKIAAQNYSIEEWAAIESDDWAQSEHLEVGFDADEMAFCFSYRTDVAEYWFQLTLAEAQRVAGGAMDQVDVRLPNR